jgi:hypothetical protein
MAGAVFISPVNTRECAWFRVMIDSSWSLKGTSRNLHLKNKISSQKNVHSWSCSFTSHVTLLFTLEV